MAKTEIKDKRTQRQKFIDKARELETDNSKEAFEGTLEAIATAPAAASKKSAAKNRWNLAALGVTSELTEVEVARGFVTRTSPVFRRL